MYKQAMYTYLGTNGTITSPVHLEDIYYVLKYRLTAEEGKILTKDNKTFSNSITVSADEVEEWKEVDKVGQNKL